MNRLIRTCKQGIDVAVKLLLIAFFAFPFLWMFGTAFKSYQDSIAYPPTLLPQSLHPENFAAVFQSGPFFTYTLNSVLVVVITMSIQFLIMVPTAYIFARYQFKGKNLLFGLVLLAFMVPNQVTFVPVYLLMAKTGLLTTLLPQIIPFAANAFGIFLLRQNFMQVSDEIVEAAMLDNASEFRLVTRVMLPMAKPALITIGLFSFINNWNSYFWPLVMTNSDKFRPLTLYVEKLKQDAEQGLQWNLIMAGNLILVVPILIIYCFGSKQIIKAFTYNGIK